MTLFKLTEWESSSGWHCADVSALAAGSSRWEHHPHIWQLPPADWIKMLIETYHATVTMFDSGVVYFYWKNQSDMRRYKNATNKKARELSYSI